eukprot:6227222-Prymnesium_polylepis.1
MTGTEQSTSNMPRLDGAYDCTPVRLTSFGGAGPAAELNASVRDLTSGKWHKIVLGRRRRHRRRRRRRPREIATPSAHAATASDTDDLCEIYGAAGLLARAYRQE